MPLPSAVQAQLERADALIAQLSQDNQPAPPAAEPLAPQAPQVAPPAPSPIVDSRPVTPASAPADPAEESRFKVLQGKYNAEVPRLHAEVERLKREAEEAKRIADHYAEQLKAVPAPPLVKPEEVEHFGEGMVDMVRRAAREELASRDKLIETLQAKVSQLATGVETTVKLGFFETLAKAHPDWGTINDDTTFHKFCGEIEPLSGRTYQDLLNAAQNAADGERASAVFTAFKKARDSWVSSSNEALGQQVVPNPGSAASGQQLDPTRSRVFSRQQVQDFYNGVRSGRIKGQEVADTEAEIQRAIAEGRIQ